MPNPLRHRGRTRPELRRTVRPLSVPILDLVPAIEQARRHHVEGLKVLMNEPKDLLEVRQNTAGELIDQKGTVRVEHRVGLSQDRFPEQRRHGGVWDAREHVIGVLESEPGQRRVRVRCGSVNHMEPLVLEAPAEEPNKVGVGLQDNQNRVGAHPAQDFRREGADTRAVLDKDVSTGPVDFRQDMVNQKT
jgi:hypothetical protein